MSTEEMSTERVAPSFNHSINRNPGCIRADDRTFRPILLHLFPEMLLNLQIFNDRFNNPVDFFQMLQIIFQIARHN
ncbi:hypothetical protein D1872_187820 [compost metagenome]